MAPLPPIIDPTLEAADAALDAVENGKRARDYLGMSGVGHECARKSWFDWRWITRAKFNAETLKRFADGNASEDVQAARLRLVPGITLLTIDPDTGRQFGFSDLRDHFKGHMDGAILGLLQAPKCWHVWEHKAVGDKKQAKLASLKAERGEKNALATWDTTYYTQAMLYCHYSGMTRHYLTCSSPGCRTVISVRTDSDEAFALRAIEKARRIIASPNPPERIAASPDFYLCRWCQHHEACWGDAMPERHCRSCMFATPVEHGQWRCEKHDKILSPREQREGCPDHRFVPSLAHGEQVDVRGDDVVYRMRDGKEWVDGGKE